MKSRVVSVKTAPNKISIEFQNGTVWEYEKGEVSYTEWTLGKPTDWFIPDTLEFLEKINRYIKEAIMLKTVEKNAAEFWQKSAIQFYKNGVSYMTIGRRCGKSQVATHMAKQIIMNKTLPPRPTKHRLVVWKDYESFDKTVDDIMGNYHFTDLRYANVHMIHCDAPQHEIEKFRGYTFDHVLFINCDESFLPPELQVTMHYAKLTYCR